MKSLPLGCVKITEERFVRASEANQKFLHKLQPDRLLSAFRKNAGLPTMDNLPYNGWEDSQIGGHTMGHYLAALAQAVSSEEDALLEKNLIYTIDELKKCQDKTGTGFIFGGKCEDGEYPEQQFDVEEEKAEGKSWVPWYTLHKIFDGLLKTAKLTKNDTALSVASRLGDWVAERVSTWTPELHKKIMNSEYGGMNDCLYELYHQTGQEKYRKAAEVFDDTALFDTINAEKKNTLMNRHANTTIPKFLGALEEHPEHAELFYKRVTRHQIYSTGGISDMEHFHEDDELDARRTQCNCEGCCAHNMLKLSHRLFERKKQATYADYAERLLFNAILAAMNPEQGTTAYFSPMATGYNKTFSQAEPEKSMFWCCTGTGMENYTNMQEELFFVDGDTLYINQYISAECETPDMKFSQKVTFGQQMKNQIIIEKVSSEIQNVAIRIPRWCVDKMEVLVDGKNGEVDMSEDYMVIHELSHNSHIELSCLLKMQVESLPDAANLVCFTYGPFVLAARLGMEEWQEKTGAGIDVVAAKTKYVGGMKAEPPVNYGETHCEILENEKVNITCGEDLATFEKNIAEHMKPADGKALHFELLGTDAEEKLGMPMVFVPYHEIIHERYGIYWYLREERIE